MPEVSSSSAYVTMVLTDSYVIGAMVMGYSLKRFTDKRMICLVTSNLIPDSLEKLSTLWELKIVSKLDSQDKAHLSLLGRPELGITLTKLHVWSLHEQGVKKAVYLDADMLVIQSIDDLFLRPEFAACPDAGWPDCFNSGLFVCEPREETHRALLLYAHQHGSFDGGDQGVLNAFFSDWSTSHPQHRIPFIYNMTSNAAYSYAPAMAHYREQIKVIHFIGSVKPWMFHRNSNGKITPHYHNGTCHYQSNSILTFIQDWWDVHDKHVLKDTKTSFDSKSQHNSNPSIDILNLHNPADKPFPNSTKFDFANYRIKWCDEVQSHFNQNIATNSSSQRLSFTKEKIKHPVPHRLPFISDEIKSFQEGQCRKLRSPTELDDPCDARYYDDPGEEE